ncbi:MAG: VOC family protein, partial [Halomonas sp.]|nr:VOC family protein [Halomonas sp.]
VKPASRAEWGGYSGYFADPDGHLWEVVHNPGFPIDAGGNTLLG